MPDATAGAYHGAATDEEKVRKVELAISGLLRVGVLTSLLVVLTGTVVTFVHHPHYLSSHHELGGLTKPGAVFPHSIPALIQGLEHGQGRAIVMAGLLLLIATPVLRVAVSILAFVYQRDRTFVVITSIVLALLLTSFVLGRGGG
ncbi:MAG TPA: DUF1634 domain-containing protein [Acidimicrobiia bacterium]|nr:DUF1634 domain-containing protein [Acidimicrobiia bacterium]